MRVAALYDVHGNLPALEAVLADVADAAVDEIVVGGDVLWGPLQVECVTALREVDARFVTGNCERDVLRPTGEIDHWCAGRLDDETRAFVETWPQTLERRLDIGRVVFCHATPRDVEEILTTLTPDDELRAALAAVEADVVVCGHTHVQFDRSVAGVPRLVNAGSVGLAYQGSPGARWALIGEEIEFRSAAYDVERAVDILGGVGFPPFADMFPRALRGKRTAEEAMQWFESQRGT